MKRGVLKKKYGPSGQAQVTVGKRSVVVLMAETRVKYEFPLDSVPKELLNGFTTGQLKVTLSDDGTRVVGVAPWNEKVIVRVKNFGTDIIPVPKHSDKPGHRKDGTEFPQDYLYFNVNMEAISPTKYAGMNIFSTFRYFDEKGGGFAPDEDGSGITTLVGKNQNVQKLESFLQATGVAEVDFPWSDNILPALLAAIRKADREFAVTIQEGWPNSFEAIAQAKKSTRKK